MGRSLRQKKAAAKTEAFTRLRLMSDEIGAGDPRAVSPGPLRLALYPCLVVPAGKVRGPSPC